MFNTKSTKYGYVSEDHKRKDREMFQSLRRLYAPPPTICANTVIDRAFARLYWGARSLQYSFFYKQMESEYEEMVDLMKWESTVHPPPIEELRRRTQESFSYKYIKYMYARFKNECPSGRMKINEFRTMFGPYLPERVSEDYFRRLFNAFSRNKEEITFQDLMETLALLSSSSPTSNAQWAMRMIKGDDASNITYPEFSEFVKSAYHFSKSPKKYSSTTIDPTKSNAIITEAIARRTEECFAALDKDGDGLIHTDDMIHFFQEVENVTCRQAKTSTERRRATLEAA